MIARPAPEADVTPLLHSGATVRMD
jgi:hypothetical protein